MNLLSTVFNAFLWISDGNSENAPEKFYHILIRASISK